MWLRLPRKCGVDGQVRAGSPLPRAAYGFVSPQATRYFELIYRAAFKSIFVVGIKRSESRELRAKVAVFWPNLTPNPSCKELAATTR
jgi:hypothetical protein